MAESSNIYPTVMTENILKNFPSSRMVQCALDVGTYFPVLVMELSNIRTGKFLKFDEILTAFLTVPFNQ